MVLGGAGVDVRLPWVPFCSSLPLLHLFCADGSGARPTVEASGLSLLFQQARSWLGLLDVNQKPFASEARFESGPAGFSHPLFARSY